MPLDLSVREGGQKASTREPGDLPGKSETKMPSGVTVRSTNMNVQTKTLRQSRARFIPAVFAALLGVTMISITGHVQAAALHDAAHDVRHATGFPCH